MSALPSLAQRPSGGSAQTSGRGWSGRARLRIVSAPSRTMRYSAVLVAVAAAGVFGVVSLNALAAESAFAARSLEAEVAELSVRYDELTAEVAALEAPGRVQAVAESELGMVPARQPGYVVLAPGSGPGGPPPGQADGPRPLADPVKPLLLHRR